MLGYHVELAVVGLWVDAPEARTADVGNARAESIAEESEQAEHDIGIRAGVGHDLHGLKFRLLFEHYGEQDQAVAQRAGHRNRVQSGELIREQVVPRHAPERAEVLRIRTGVNGTDRNHETHPVGRGDFTAAPSVSKGDAILCCDQSGVAGGNCFIAQIVLLDPGNPIPAQRRHVVADERFRSRVAGLGEKRGAQTQNKIRGSRRSIGQMRKRLSEAGPQCNLQDQFRQLYSR